MFGRRTERYFCRLRKNPPVAFKQSEQEKGRETRLSKFLSELDEFDRNEYIKVIHFDEMQSFRRCSVSSFRRQNITTGLEEMMASELHFFKATAPFQIKKTSYHVQ